MQKITKLSEVLPATKNYKEYRATLNQTEVAAPVPTAECGEITGVTHGRTATAGRYTITKVGGFGASKTSVVFSSTFGWIYLDSITDDVITYEVYPHTDGAIASDGKLLNTGIIITVKN